MKNKTLLKILKVNILINFILFLNLLWVLFCFIYYPLPERTNIKYMTPDMINEGQGIAIVSFEICFWILVILLPFALVLSSILSAKILLKYNYINKFNLSIFSKILLMIYGIINIIFSIFTSYFMIIFYKKIKNDNSDYEMFGRFKRLKLNWNILTISANVFIIMVPATFFSYELIKFNHIYNKIPNRKRDLEDAWTLSSNKPNTMVLYFDRATGLIFNELLAIDYLIFKDNGTSLAQLYPEFTSYVNTLSLSQSTNGSIPSIYGSYFTKPLNKTKNEKNQFIDLIDSKNVNKDLTYDNWNLMALLVKAKVLENYGYKNISINNIPYYDDFNPWNKWYRNSNSTKLESNMKSKINNDTNLHIFDEREVSKALGFNPVSNFFKVFDFDVQNFKQFTSHKNNFKNINKIPNTTYGANQLMNNNLNLKVSSTKNKTYLMMHEFLTHEKYAYIKSNIDDGFDDGINNANPSEGIEQRLERSDNGLWTSTWYMIQKLKNIFDYLKMLPYNGDHSDVIKNQYDNTTIYIISDHGHGLTDTNDLDKVQNFLVKNNIMTNKQANYMHDLAKNNSMITNYNSLFATKPRKYIHENWNKKTNDNSTLENIYDKKAFISVADFVPIMDSLLQKENADFDEEILDFKFNISQSIFNNKYDDNFIIDPLNNINLLNKRSLELSKVEAWKRYNDKDFGITKIYEFIPNNSIYDIKNYSSKTK